MEVISNGMHDEGLRSAYYGWYRSQSIKFEIVKLLYKREFATIKRPGSSTFRMLKCHNLSHFDYLWNRIVRAEDHDEIHNLYYSLARYREGIPNQTFTGEKRDHTEWNKSHHLYMESYDFLLDVDAHNGKEELIFAYDAAFEIKEFFDDLNVPYELRFSGNGFHFIIPYSYFMTSVPIGYARLDPKQSPNIYQYYTMIAKYFYQQFSDLIDWKIYDSRRVCKVPYSIAAYPDIGRFVICLPFSSDEQFKMFGEMIDGGVLNLINAEPDAFIRRGNYLFNSQGNLDKMIKKIGLNKLKTSSI